MANERKFVTENIRRHLLKEYVMKAVDRAGFGGLEIQRTPMGTRVTLITERPGLVIGRRGSAIKTLTMAIEKDFSFRNPQIEVQEVLNPNLNAQIMAEKLASALERGWHFRRAGHSTVRRIMEAGAKGCQVTIAGKLTGRRHRRVKFRQGHIKYCGEARLDFMWKGFAVAKLKPGVIGVTVWIMDPHAKLPDDIEIASVAPAPAAAAAGAEAAAAVRAETELERKAEAAVKKLKAEAAEAGAAAPEAEAPAKPKRRTRKKAEPAAAAEGRPEEEPAERKTRRRKKAEPAAATEAATAPEASSSQAPTTEEKPPAPSAEPPAEAPPKQEEPQP